MNARTLQAGDHIYVWRYYGIIRYQHHGIVIGTNIGNVITVVHFSSGNQGVRRDTLPVFLTNEDGLRDEFRYAEYGCSYISASLLREALYTSYALPAHITVSLALAALQGNHDGWANIPYNVVSNNSESFASYCKLGQKPLLPRQSTRVIAFGTLGILSSGAGAAVVVGSHAAVGATGAAVAIGSHVAAGTAVTVGSHAAAGAACAVGSHAAAGAACAVGSHATAGAACAVGSHAAAGVGCAVGSHAAAGATGAGCAVGSHTAAGTMVAAYATGPCAVVGTMVVAYATGPSAIAGNAAVQYVENRVTDHLIDEGLNIAGAVIRTAYARVSSSH